MVTTSPLEPQRLEPTHGSSQSFPKKFRAKKSTRHFCCFPLPKSVFKSFFVPVFKSCLFQFSSHFVVRRMANSYWEQHFLERSEGHPPSKHLPGPKSLKLESNQGPNKNLITITLTLIAAYHSPLPYNII